MFFFVKIFEVKIEENEKIRDLNDAIKYSENFSNEKYEQMSITDEKDNSNFEKIKKEEKNIQVKDTTAEEKEKLEEAEEIVKKQSSKKKKIWNLIFFLINVGVIAGILTYQILNEDGLTSLTDLSTKLNWWIITLIIAVFALIIFLETLKFWILTYKTTKKNRFSLSYKISAIGRYYDNITPFATGGQPFQIYYLNKRGVSGAESLSITMGNYVIWQLSFITFTLVIMIFSLTLNNFLNAGTVFITASSWIGFAINSALVILVGLLSINKRIGTKLVNGTLKLLKKMKLIKNYDKHYNKIMEMVDTFQITMKKYAKDKWSFIFLIFVNYLTFFLVYSLPFLIHAAFFGFDFSIFTTIFIYIVMIDLTASYLPLPGGTGAAELSFTALFSLYFVDGTIFWAMIIWRIFTYYAYLLQGILIIIYDYFAGDKRHQWEEKKWTLEAESRTFEENQTKEFELLLEKEQKKNKKKIKAKVK